MENAQSRYVPFFKVEIKTKRREYESILNILFEHFKAVQQTTALGMNAEQWDAVT